MSGTRILMVNVDERLRGSMRYAKVRTVLITGLFELQGKKGRGKGTTGLGFGEGRGALQRLSTTQTGSMKVGSPP